MRFSQRRNARSRALSATQRNGKRMLTLSSILFGLVAVASLPYWLPSALVALRVHIFTGINGAEGISIPGELVDASRFKQVYSHPAAKGRRDRKSTRLN